MSSLVPRFIETSVVATTMKFVFQTAMKPHTRATVCARISAVNCAATSAAQRFFCALGCAALLNACANVPSTPEDAASSAPNPAALAAEKPVEYVERAFPDDSLHELLLAEFALRRQEFNTALDTYLEQAPLLRDPGVSAHTTRLAQYLERGDDVLKTAQLWVELEPENLEARATLARQLVLAGRNTDAVAHLAALERSGENANFTILTNAFEKLTPEAQHSLVTDLDSVAGEFPTSDSLLLTRALLHNQLSNQQTALANLEALFEIKPDHPQALILEASILADRDEAAAFARVDQYLAKNPDDHSLRRHYARLLATKDIQAARTQFEILSAQAPRDGDLLFSLALINREIGDPLAAGAYLRQMIELGQRSDEARYYLGRLEQDRERPEEALAHYQAIENGAEYLAANSRIGEILLEQRQVERSLAWFASQRQRYPELSERLYGLETDLLLRSGDGERATLLLAQALNQFPEDAGLLYARAMVREQDGDLAGMEADLRTILTREPENVTALNALGYTLANRTQRFGEALELVSRALKLQPDEPAILDSMGWIMFRMQRLDEALDFLTRAYAKFPDPEVAAHLGEVMWAMGDTAGARNIWSAAATDNPDHPILTRTLQRLNVEALGPAPVDDKPTQ